MSDLISQAEAVRERLLKQTARFDELSRQVLGLSWCDTESQARQVIRHIVQQETADVSRSIVRRLNDELREKQQYILQLEKTVAGYQQAENAALDRLPDVLDEVCGTRRLIDNPFYTITLNQVKEAFRKLSQPAE